MGYITINTHKGLYRYKRLPYGVALAPAIFRKVMESILQGIPNVAVYIDDLSVTGKTDQEHLSTLKQVFELLKQHGLKIKRSKCAFMYLSVEYLGHIVSEKGLQPTTDKVKAIMGVPKLKNLTELRAYLGLVNYYGKFLPNLAAKTHPLNKLLRKEQKWVWDKTCEEAFHWSKTALAADASAYGIGAVISHVMQDGTEHPIAFASRTLSSSERNYSQIEKEALGLVYAVRKFHQFIYGHHFTLVTDHKPLLVIHGPKKEIPPLAAARMQRWAFQLSAYDYEILFKPTTAHSNADGLSRLPLQHTQPALVSTNEVAQISLFNLAQVQALPISSQQLGRATLSDPVLSKVFRYTKSNWPSGTLEDTLKPYWYRKNELTVEGDCVMLGIRVIVPKKWQEAVLSELHATHPSIQRMTSLACSHVWWPGLEGDIDRVVKSCKACQEMKTTSSNCSTTPMGLAWLPVDPHPCGFCGTILRQFLSSSCGCLL